MLLFLFEQLSRAEIVGLILTLSPTTASMKVFRLIPKRVVVSGVWVRVTETGCLAVCISKYQNKNSVLNKCMLC